jgi:hypothetical protein
MLLMTTKSGSEKLKKKIKSTLTEIPLLSTGKRASSCCRETCRLPEYNSFTEHSTENISRL